MAAGMISVYIICTVGITAAVSALLISITGFIVLVQGLRHFEDER